MPPNSDSPSPPHGPVGVARALAASTSDYLERMGAKGRLEYVSGDVRSQEGMWKLAETIGDREGRLDVCIASAGIFAGSVPSLEYPEEQFQRVIDINLKGVLFTAQAAGRQMLKLGTGGSIIFIASVAGHIALEPDLLTVSYASSKAALHQLARSMATEHAPNGIRVNTISPSYIVTAMTSFLSPEEAAHLVRGIPMKRMGRPDELRGAVTWLASDASSFCTGSDIVVSGGHTASGQ